MMQVLVDAAKEQINTAKFVETVIKFECDDLKDNGEDKHPFEAAAQVLWPEESKQWLWQEERADDNKEEEKADSLSAPVPVPSALNEEIRAALEKHCARVDSLDFPQQSI